MATFRLLVAHAARAVWSATRTFDDLSPFRLPLRLPFPGLGKSGHSAGVFSKLFGRDPTGRVAGHGIGSRFYRG
jgi:hypothetical protein